MSIENDSFHLNIHFCESEMLQHVQDMFKTNRTIMIMQVAEKWIADWRYKW